MEVELFVRAKDLDHSGELWVMGEDIELEAALDEKLEDIVEMISDSQSFPAAFGKLGLEAGAFSKDETYAEADLRGLVAFAEAAGVRVVPEIDVPAHALSWAKAYPALIVPCAFANGDGASKSDAPALDPTDERTYALVAAVLDAAAAVFPDAVFHVGADEVRAECWSDPRLEAWGEAHLGSGSPRALFGHFLARVARLVASRDRRVMVWQDALDFSSAEGLAALEEAGATVEPWKCWGGSAARAADRALARNLTVVDASCWYLDWPSPWRNYGEKALLRAEDPRVLGGEAALWTEETDFTSFGCRAWPRAAVVASLLWHAPGSFRGLSKFAAYLRARLGVRAALPADASGETGAAGRGLCPPLARTFRRPARPPARAGVAFLNADDGAATGDRSARLDAWLREEVANGTVAAAFAEANGWGAPGEAHGFTLLQERAARAGFAFSTLEAFRGAHPFSLAVASAAPIARRFVLGPPAFERGVLAVDTGGLTLIVAHLDAHDAEKRAAEAETLAAELRRTLDGRPAVLVGDFNALSRTDADEAAVLRWLAALDASPGPLDARRKFATAGAVDFRAADALEAALADLCRGTCGPTIPTGLEPDAPEVPAGARQLPLRLDYALGNAALAAFAPRVDVRRDDLTRAMSDHFPLRVSWPARRRGGGEGRGGGGNLSFYEVWR